MNKFIKKHIGLIIILFIAIVFPASLSNQAKLNMRIIVTGISIDKVENDYEVTAQIVKTISGSESPGTSAKIEFISDKAETVSKAISKLLYKAGKVSALSHTNFLILGKSILKEDVTKCLDVFLRDKIIKNSAMILFSEEKAKDEMQKTQFLELSVGLGLQKVYSFKQQESDGLMITILNFVNENNIYGKTAVSSMFKLVPYNSESSGSSSESSSGGSSSSSESSSGGSSSSSESSSGGSSSSSGSSGGTSGGSGSQSSESGSGSEKNSKMYFVANTPTYVFVNGNFKYAITDIDQNNAFMIANEKSKTSYIEIENFNYDKNENTKSSVIIKNKRVKKKISFNNQSPCLELEIVIDNSELNEIISNEKNKMLTNSQVEKIKLELQKKIASNIGTLFENSKENGADLFDAYELAYKYHYTDLTKYYASSEEFISNLKISVDVKVKGMEY